MVKEHLAEGIMILITVALIAFFAGVYLRGRTGGDIRVEVERTSPSASVSEAASGTKREVPVTSDLRLNLNQATLEELETLPGIGPVLAQRIIDYRDAHGGFHSVSELLEVEGLGEKTYEKLSDYVKVGE